MTLANDANVPIRFKGRTYKPLTMRDVAEITEAIPDRLMPKALLPFVGVTDAMRFARSPFGLAPTMALIAEKSGTPTDDLPVSDQLELMGRMTDRLYGFDEATAEVEDGLAEDADDEDKEPAPPLADAPAS